MINNGEQMDVSATKADQTTTGIWSDMVIPTTKSCKMMQLHLVCFIFTQILAT